MSNWKPIETAPDDEPILIIGGEVLVIGMNASYALEIPMVAQKLSTGNFDSLHTAVYSSEAINPTHWMPLPKPPIEEGK